MNTEYSTTVTTMSSKGQIVLPKIIRTQLSLNNGSSFVIFTDGVNILLKPIQQPNITEFSLLCEQSRQWAQSVGMQEEDIFDAIKQVRKNKKK